MSEQPPPKKPAISSPCILVCTVDGRSGLCLGCYRTLEEIANWSRLPEPERRRLMGILPLRASRIDPALRGENG